VKGVILAAIYMLWAYQRTFQGPARQREGTIRDILPLELVAVIPVVAAMLFIGVYPKVVLDRVNPTTEGATQWVQSVRVDEPNLPGGQRAEIEPSYRPSAEIQAALAQGAP